MAEDSVASKPSPTLDAQASKITQIKSKLDAQTPKTGRLDAQRPQFDSTEEPRYPSRIKTERPNVRLDRELMKVVRKELKTWDRAPKLSRVIEDGLRLWLQARARARLDAQASTGSSSCSGSSSLDLEDLEKTTTTTTLDAQTPKSPPLPGFAASVEDMPHKSKHPLPIILAYGLEINRTTGTITDPLFWATRNYMTGKHDVVIQLWTEQKETAETEKKRRAEAKAKQQQEEREFEGRIRKEREERAASGKKPWDQ